MRCSRETSVDLALEVHPIELRRGLDVALTQASSFMHKYGARRQTARANQLSQLVNTFHGLCPSASASSMPITTELGLIDESPRALRSFARLLASGRTAS